MFIILEVAKDNFGGHRPGIHHSDCLLTLAPGYWMPIRWTAGADWRLEKWSGRVWAPVHHFWRSSHEECSSVIISSLISLVAGLRPRFDCNLVLYLLLFDTEDTVYLFLWLLRQHVVLAFLCWLASLSTTITLHRSELLSRMHISLAHMSLLTKWRLQIVFHTYCCLCRIFLLVAPDINSWMRTRHICCLVNVTRSRYSRLKPAITTFLIHFLFMFLPISSAILLLLSFLCSRVFLWVNQW